ncbi:MAG: SDR family oxidoreductase [Chloroflexales bacterium]|nr:SDR family oxidoreductase [Chloroflexales bacterium]
MMLAGKNVLVFAATGGIGSEVARTFAREGAHVFISGRSADAVEQLAGQLRAAGGNVSAEIVDATDAAAVQAYVDQVVAEVGSIDATFNAIGQAPSALAYPARSTEQSLDDFFKPLHVILGSTFLTSRTVGAQMVRQGSGSIVTLSATLSVWTPAYMAGITAACAAIEGLTRSLAGEFGPAGVRVNCVRGNAMFETRTIAETGAGLMALGYQPSMSPTLLGRPITISETAATAAFLASDGASGITAQVLTVAAGAFPVG